MRVLLLSPFPVVRQGADASATMLPELIRRLSYSVDLHVLAPAPATGQDMELLGNASYVALDSAEPRSIRTRLGRRPYWQAAAWGSRTELVVAGHIKRIAPDLVHGEYLQVGNSIVDAPCPTLLTLHDVSTDVMKRSLFASSIGASPYRLAEYARTYAFERSVVRRTTLPVALSADDCARLRRWNPATTMIPPAFETPRDAWKIDSKRLPIVVFAGAMWRNANIAAARFLVHDVLPLLRDEIGNVELRIVGTDPAPEVQKWARVPGVRILGTVPSVEAEMLQGSVVAAPSVFGGGILVKALTAAMLGCPTVVSPRVARSLGLSRHEVAIAATAEDFASELVRLIRDGASAAALGGHARTYAARRFSWSARVGSYRKCYEALVS